MYESIYGFKFNTIEQFERIWIVLKFNTIKQSEINNWIERIQILDLYIFLFITLNLHINVEFYMLYKIFIFYTEIIKIVWLSSVHLGNFYSSENKNILTS